MFLLIADDDRATRTLLAHHLESAGHEVVTCANGDEALSVLRENPSLRLALLDWRMPGGLEGSELCERITGLERTIYIIIVTADGEAQATVSALQSGAHDYIVKPWNKEILLARVGVGCRLVSMQEQVSLQATALESTANAILITDRRARIQWVNPAFSLLTGYSFEEVIGENPRLFKSGKHSEAFYQDMWSTITSGRTWMGEIIDRRKDGALYTEEITITPVKQGDKITHFIAIKHDVTKRKELEAQLAHAQKLESIGQLAAGIAHEINTPTQYVGDNTRFVRDSVDDLLKLVDRYGELLTSVKTGDVEDEQISEMDAAIEELDLEFIKDEIPKAIEQTLEGVDRVAEIVRAMKDFSHPGSEEKTPTDLNKAIESTITVCKNRWKYVADLETDLQSDLPMTPCMVGEFNQVILNLIVNAADAIGDVVGDGDGGKGTITVSTRQAGSFVEIRVRDTGGGIPENIVSRIFDPFFTTKEVGKGTGQGLAISHDVVVNKHGGTIEVQTEMGEGTTFIIQLPIKDEACERASGGHKEAA